MSPSEAGRSPTWPDTGDHQGAPVTFDDYELAVDRYITCMEDLGYTLRDVRLEPVSQIYEWSLSPEADSDPRAQNCYKQHLGDLDLRWQSQRQRELAPLWERRRRHIIDCLEERHVTLDSGLSYPAVVEAASEAGHSDCVVSAPWEDWSEGA